MIKLGIIFGGQSGEHDVSLMSASSIIHAINREKYEVIMIGITREGEWLLYDGPIDMIESGDWEDYAKLRLLADSEKYDLTILSSKLSLKDKVDIVFPVLHGPMGEDGTIQGLLEMMGVPYVGCGVLASSMAMDKGISKKIFEAEDLPICQYSLFMKEKIQDNLMVVIHEIEEIYNYPVFVKPANMGSSVGISKAKDQESLKEALSVAIQHDRRVIVEEYISCREVETAVIGNAVPVAAAVGEIIPSKEFYDYEAKYCDDGASEMIIPAQIPQDIAAEIKKIAIKAYQALDCRGCSRVDFFLEKETNRIFINEINTMPGFTKYSMFPALWKEAGLNYQDLIDRLVGYALEK